MVSVKLNSTDRELLNLLQAEFPLTPEPYADLGVPLGISGDEVRQHIGRLKSEGIIRQISPVMDAGRLSYQTTLAAMRVAGNRLAEAEKVIGEHPGVSHAYERDHHFNFWFTLAIPRETDVDNELEKLAGSIGAETAFSLSATKLFKLRAYFDMGGNGQTAATSQSDTTLSGETELSPADRLVINELQQDLPLVPEPFTDMSARLGMNAADFLAQCRSLKQRGVIRRYGAAVNHRQAGFNANAMTCWTVPAETVNIAGEKLASLREVSHCYERKTNPQWQYNLFAMIHGHSKEDCREIADRVTRETGLADYLMLFSTREFKKTRIKYLV